MKGRQMLKKRVQEASRNRAVGEQVIVPVAEEQVRIGKRLRKFGVTRIRKKVHELIEVIDEPLQQDDIQVERVAVNHFIDAPVPVRQEGDTTIVPVFEEILVVQKRLMLKEELHIKKQTKTVRKSQDVNVHKEHVVIEHDNVKTEDR